ncbi:MULTISPECIES: winged helix-turn-helix transcriptional regulator [Streptomyces]|uniref:winged helix-turn-helix transcriptional regulator n=1 Tax=Streptomyces TaxID=1883 RepID=UPI00200E5AEF|nr:helix-turn-helix domain-containing protein [Streptomyces sp. LRE541]UPZ33949.1 helix-turn-helix transcriptional regulator [Streptomyces sp. LRE541]
MAIEIISSKWAVVTLFALTDGPVRHGELAELIGGVSRKVLTQTLRRLQDNGLVERRAYAEAPPRVEYGLTELGRTLEEPIRKLTEWARVNGEAVVAFHEAAEDASDR